MDNDVEGAILSFGVTELEIVFILIMLSLCMILHEFLLYRRTKNKIDIVSIIPEFIIAIFVDTIICIAINPLVMSVNPRLMLLPPFLLGLIGPELLRYMTALKSLLKLIEYILSLVGIGKKKPASVDDIDGDKITREELEAIKKYYNKRILKLNKRISNLMEQYFAKNIEKAEFILRYERLSEELDEFIDDIRKHKELPFDTGVKLSSLIKNRTYLDRLYNFVSGISN